MLLADDVPGRRTYGLEHADQPVLAYGQVRYVGEPVAIVAADHPDIARPGRRGHRGGLRGHRAADRSRGCATRGPIHPDGNVFRELNIRHGDQDATGEVVVEGTYEVGMQDQAFMGPESGFGPAR